MKHKWKNLKDYYRNERKKTKRSKKLGSSSKEEFQYESRWPYYSYMHFLDKTLNSKPRLSNVSELEVTTNSIKIEENLIQMEENSIQIEKNSIKIEENSDNEELDIYSNKDDYIDSNNVTHSLGQTNNISVNNLNNKPSTSKNRKIERNELLGRILELEENKFKLLENDKEDNDQDLLFFKSLLPDFKILPRTKRMHLKLKFQELLFDEVSLHESLSS